MDSKMKNINVEDIMAEIRAEIKENRYNDSLSFQDCITDVTNDSHFDTAFDKIKFNEELYSLNHYWNVQGYRPLHGNIITIFVKRLIRKLIKFYIEPVINDQNNYNAITTRIFNLVNVYIEQQRIRDEELMAEYDELRYLINRKMAKDFNLLRRDFSNLERSLDVLKAENDILKNEVEKLKCREK